MDTPEVPNWVLEELAKMGVILYPVEGFSVKDNSVSALFERGESSAPITNWSSDEIEEFLQNSNNTEWICKTDLATILDVPLYFVIYEKNIERFRLFEITNHGGHVRASDYRVFPSCSELAKWLSRLKGIQVSKPFVEPGRLSNIDDCLRKHGVPWPGNLDGFILDKRRNSVSAIFEMSRTKKNPVKYHDLNRYYGEDINRWRPLDILRKQTNSDMYVIIWSSEEEIVRLLKVKNLAPRLEWISDKTIGKEELGEKVRETLNI